MKKSLMFLAILLVVIQFAIIAIPVSAAGGDILKGTPIMDGALDDIYKQSYNYTITIDNPVYNAGAEYADAADTAATSYFLWDDKYIYVCTVVTDSTLLSIGKDALAAVDYEWQNDIVEMWWLLDDVQICVNLDAFGYKMTGSPTLTGDKGFLGKATNNGKNSYIIEFAFPNPIKAGGTFNYSTQLNNILKADKSEMICIGEQRSPHEFTLSAKQVLLTVVEKEPAKTTTPAAQTSDIGIALSMVTLAASAFVALKAKKK